MRQIWEDAAGILETATAAGNAEPSEIAILVDSRNGLRIVNAGGWQLDALRREYQACAAYTVKRTAQSVVVDAQDGGTRCTLQKSIRSGGGLSPYAGIPHHLIRQERLLTA